MIQGIISGVIVTAFFMAFQVFFLTRWVEKHELEKNKLLWTPFRKLLLDSIVQHADSLTSISVRYEKNINSLFSIIREKGSLDLNYKNKLNSIINETIEHINHSKNDFYNKVQTVGPALQPYAASYCNEVFWFGDAFLKSLEDSLVYLAKIDDSKLDDNLHTSPQLGGVWAKAKSIMMFKDCRFSSFKKFYPECVERGVSTLSRWRIYTSGRLCHRT